MQVPQTARELRRVIYLTLIAAAIFQLSNIYIYNRCSTDSAPWLLPTYLAIALMSNLLWYGVAKSLPGKGELITIAMIWDVQGLFAVFVIPILIYGFRGNPQFWVGAALCVAGIIVMKTGN